MSIPDNFLRAMHRPTTLRQPTYDHHPQNTGQAPKLERDPGDAPLAAGEVQEGAAGRVHLRVVSIRKRLCDPDNLSPKGIIDCLRFAGAISNDSSEDITLEVTQRKTAKGEAEHTLVTITYPPSAALAQLRIKP